MTSRSKKEQDSNTAVLLPLILDASPLCGSLARLTAALRKRSLLPPRRGWSGSVALWWRGPLRLVVAGAPPFARLGPLPGPRPGWWWVFGAWSPRPLFCGAAPLSGVPSRSVCYPALIRLRRDPLRCVPRSLRQGPYPLGRGNFSFAPVSLTAKRRFCKPADADSQNRQFCEVSPSRSNLRNTPSEATEGP